MGVVVLFPSRHPRGERLAQVLRNYGTPDADGRLQRGLLAGSLALVALTAIVLQALASLS